MSRKRIFTRYAIIALCAMLLLGCTTVTRRDGSKVRIPAAGYVGSMAATNIACQDNVQALSEENAKLRVQVSELQSKLNAASR
jgi:outer membrane protein assembly factor BamE (lipoprotein component of BamABCDE complex)